MDGQAEKRERIDKLRDLHETEIRKEFECTKKQLMVGAVINLVGVR